MKTLKKFGTALASALFLLILISPIAVNAQKYSCQVDRGTDPPTCILNTSDKRCADAGLAPGNACSSTGVDVCETVELDCADSDDRGQEFKPCKPGNICNSGLYCALEEGFICKACGGANQTCCPKPALACGASTGLLCRDNRCVQGVCAEDPYGDQPTYCSVTAGPQRVIVQGYSGCRFGEFCVRDNESFGDGSSGGSAESSIGLDTIEKNALPDFKFKGGTVGQVIQSLLPWLFAFAGIGLLIYLLYGGIHLMISGGDPKVIAEAKGKITNAILGFVIVFVAYWLVQIVSRVFGLQGIVDIFG